MKLNKKIFALVLCLIGLVANVNAQSVKSVSAEYVFMSWSSKEIILRDTYKSTNTTKHWQAG